MFVIGVDLASQQDWTALSILETKSDKGRRSMFCGALQRWRAPYTETVNKVAAIAERRAFRDAALVVDQTGVGRPVVDMLRLALPGRRVVGVTITAGSIANRGEHNDDIRVPKKLLVSTLQVLFGEGRLKFSSEMELLPTLQSELQAFRVKITANANESFEAWRERDHDDLVLSVALAAWFAENVPTGTVSDARVANCVLNGSGLSGKDLAAGEGVRTRMEAIAQDFPDLFGD